MGRSKRGTASKRGTLRLLADPSFGGLFWGKLVSVVGVWIHSVVAAVVIFEVTHSATAVSLVSLVQYGPQIAFAPLSGALTDRGHIRSQLIVGRLLCTIGSGCLAAWIGFVGVDHGWTTAAAILVTSFVVGLGFVVGGPAQQAVVPQMVTPAELPTAMVLNTAPSVLGRNGGPVLGALLLAAFGSTSAFAIAAGTHLVFTGILCVIALPRNTRPPPHSDSSFRHALRYVRHNRSMSLLLLASTMSAVGSEPTITLTPLIAERLGGGAHDVAILSIAFGVGSTVGFATTAAFARLTSQVVTTSAGLMLLTIGSALAAVTQSRGPVIVAFAAVGWGFGWAMMASTTLIQQHVPSHLRGRVMAMWLMGFVGARPIAAAAVGVIADLASVTLAFATLAAALALVALKCRPAMLRNVDAGQVAPGALPSN